MRPVRIILTGLVAVCVLHLIAQTWHLDWVLKLNAPVRLVLAVLTMLPAGLLIGMPFPLGIRNMASGAAGRAYAWSVNGCGSVLSAILAAQLAISFGISYLLIGAMIAYGFGLVGAIRFSRSVATVDNAANHGI